MEYLCLLFKEFVIELLCLVILFVGDGFNISLLRIKFKIKFGLLNKNGDFIRR